MGERRIDTFFYGLFMDRDVLAESRVAAENPRRAHVDGYALRIGERATLVAVAGARAYGVVFALRHDELARLYSAPGLEEYRAEAVVARLLDGGEVPALCYNLLEAPAPGATNEEYATRLRETLRRLGFPPDYVASIA